MPTEPLTPEELAEVKKLSARLRFLMSDNYGAASDGGDHAIAEMDAANWLDRLLAAAEHLAECERQLAEARAVIVFDRHPDSDFSWKRPPFYVTAVEAAHAASRRAKEPEHE